MSSQELLNLLRQLLTLGGGLLAGAGILNVEQASTVTNDLVVAIPALVSLGSVTWSVYAHWKMKKVPEKSTALMLTGEPKLPSGTVLDLTPLRGEATVVG